MSNNFIISVGREFGSGGKAIAALVADKLGVKLYDKELIDLAATSSGMSSEVLSANDESASSAMFVSLSFDTMLMNFGNNYNISQSAFFAQADAIKALADKESCVIVGRCSDYVLRDYPGLVSVFINADHADKVNMVSKLHNVSEDKAYSLMKKADKKRANYYNYYSDNLWGVASTYDLCINSSRIGYSGAADTIIEYLKIKEKISEEN